MTQQEIKDNYANSVGYEDWKELLEDHCCYAYRTGDLQNLEKYMGKVIQLVAQQALENASENAKTDSDHPNCGVRVDKSSITNPDNIPML